MDEQLRKDIWDGMVNSDRLARYYGALASRLALKEKAAAVATPVLASLTAFLMAYGTTAWMEVAGILATVATSTLALIWRTAPAAAATAYRVERIQEIHIGYKNLWQWVADGVPAEDTERLRSFWNGLQLELNRVTAEAATEPVRARLQKQSEKGAYDYWKKQADSPRKTTSPQSITGTKGGLIPSSQ